MAEAVTGPPDRPIEPSTHRLPRSEKLSAAGLLSLLGFLECAGDRSHPRMNDGIVRLLMEEWEVQPARPSFVSAFPRVDGFVRCPVRSSLFWDLLSHPTLFWYFPPPSLLVTVDSVIGRWIAVNLQYGVQGQNEVITQAAQNRCSEIY